jgi:hypothetical protein
MDEVYQRTGSVFNLGVTPLRTNLYCDSDKERYHILGTELIDLLLLIVYKHVLLPVGNLEIAFTLGIIQGQLWQGSILMYLWSILTMQSHVNYKEIDL